MKILLLPLVICCAVIGVESEVTCKEIQSEVSFGCLSTHAAYKARDEVKAAGTDKEKVAKAKCHLYEVSKDCLQKVVDKYDMVGCKAYDNAVKFTRVEKINCTGSAAAGKVGSNDAPRPSFSTIFSVLPLVALIILLLQ